MCAFNFADTVQLLAAAILRDRMNAVVRQVVKAEMSLADDCKIGMLEN